MTNYAILFFFIINWLASFLVHFFMLNHSFLTTFQRPLLCLRTSFCRFYCLTIKTSVKIYRSIVSKAYAAISNILYMDSDSLMPWQVEGLQLAQECLKEYTSFVDMLASEKLLTKKEVSDGNV